MFLMNISEGVWIYLSLYKKQNEFKVILKLKNNSKNSIFENGIINYLLSKKEKKNRQFFEEMEYLRESHDLIFNANRAYNNSSQFYYNQIISKEYKI